MTHSSAHSPASPGRSLLGRVLGDRHFLITVGILTLTAVGWGAAVRWLGIVTQKKPVPWPEGVVLDEDHRLLSLPERLGPFERARDGELTRDNKTDGKPDGEIVYTQTDMDSLGVGTDFDRTRFKDRRSNWYVSRVYVDRRPNAVPRYWRLDLTYYTGGLDLVPHVPDICLWAGGMSVLGSDGVAFTVPGCSGDWGRAVRFRRTRYEDKAGRMFVEYYGFSLNGVPQDTREKVRGKLLNPFMRYSYFAKIQFSPLWMSVENLEETDRKAEEFLRHALPEILKVLPSARAVKALENSKQ